jgi:hypothetical protein
LGESDGKDVRDRSDAAMDEAELVAAESFLDLDRPRVVDTRMDEDLTEVVEWAETERSRGEDVGVDSSMAVCQASVGACEPDTTTME